jgi:hypothetical protein
MPPGPIIPPPSSVRRTAAPGGSKIPRSTYARPARPPVPSAASAARRVNLWKGMWLTGLGGASRSGAGTRRRRFRRVGSVRRGDSRRGTIPRRRVSPATLRRHQVPHQKHHGGDQKRPEHHHRDRHQGPADPTPVTAIPYHHRDPTFLNPLIPSYLVENSSSHVPVRCRTAGRRMPPGDDQWPAEIGCGAVR